MKRSIVDIESSVGSGGARGINVGGMIAVCFYICYILGVYKVDLLFGMQELSIFLPGKDFFLESLALPGGFLLYMGDFFLQFCYEPWLGAFLLVVLFFLLQFLVCRVMNIPSDCRLLALIPSLLFLLLIARLDYRMYILRDSGMIYSQLLGGRVDDIFRCFRFRAQELGRCGMGCLIRVAAACGMCSVVL